ncbi:MAG: c-type cytochrome, partial [Limisphaerales bacterium]
TQLTNFRKSIRGTSQQDPHGLQMSAIAKSLDPNLLQALGRFVSALPHRPTTNTLRGDLQRGQLVYREICMQCHRYNASGEKVFSSPPLHGLQDWYIERQLKHFRIRIRGGDSRDIKGAKMHLMVNDLTDVELRGVASYIAVLAERHLPSEKAINSSVRAVVSSKPHPDQ